MIQLVSSWQKVRFDQICKNVSKRIDNPKESGFEKFVGLDHLDTLEPKITRWGSSTDVKSSKPASQFVDP